MKNSDILQYSTFKYKEETVLNLPTPMIDTIIQVPYSHPNIGTVIFKFRYEGLDVNGMRLWREVLS